MAIKLRPYSETIKENISKEDLIGWIVELEAEVREATDLALERAAQACKDEMVDGSVSHEDQVYNLALTHAIGSIMALKSRP